MELAPSAIQSIGLEDIDVFRRKIYSDCDDGNRPRGDMLGHLEKPSQMCIYENSDVYYSSTRQPLDEDLPIASTPLLCVRLEGNTKRTGIVDFPYYEGLIKVLGHVEHSKRHLVFIDGVTDDNSSEESVCVSRLQKNSATRRLVMVTAMTSRRKVQLDDDAHWKVKEHIVSSWSLDEALVKSKYYLRLIQ
ncbi:hypothetical protein L916_09911 [Phytophthora nicotianae]|uniref:Uncharacterized protein n=1 Tax=Phytophthora nicotianae TaxID=4792 RepID=W2IY78_PHYNI|nr:hypothetical protein L916_09911 [Phytophthora nicotianae]